MYFWADGIYANVRLEDEENSRQCLLVLMGATADGHKELIAVVDGFRESEQSWYEVLVGLQQRGLKHIPKLVVGDGALGSGQRCARCIPRPANSAAGCTRRPTC